MKHALALALVLAGCLDVAPEDDATDTSSDVQALNGDTWTMADNNGYTNGLGATYNAIAVHQTTNRAFVAGARTETSGATLWIVRATQADGTFVQNDTFTLGGPSRATAAVSDAAGNVFVAGEAIDGSGVPHWVIRETTNNGASWNTVEDRAYFGQLHAVPSSMSVDGWDFTGIFVTGTITSPSNAVAELTQRAPSGAAAFADFSTVSGRAPLALCTTWNGTALTASIPATTKWLVTTTTHGNTTWDSITPPLDDFAPFSCSMSPTNNATLVGGAQAGVIWEMGQIKTDGTPIPGGVDPISAGYGTQIRAQLSIIGRGMAAGAITTSGGVQKWRTRYTTDSTLVTWLDSDSWSLAAGKPSIAKAMTHDGGNLNGNPGSSIYVAGEATDANGRVHGIVRKMVIGQ